MKAICVEFGNNEGTWTWCYLNVREALMKIESDCCEVGYCVTPGMSRLSPLQVLQKGDGKPPRSCYQKELHHPSTHHMVLAGYNNHCSTSQETVRYQQKAFFAFLHISIPFQRFSPRVFSGVICKRAILTISVL